MRQQFKKMTSKKDTYVNQSCWSMLPRVQVRMIVRPCESHPVGAVPANTSILWVKRKYLRNFYTRRNVRYMHLHPLGVDDVCS